MTKLLFCSEMGVGHGHVASLCAIADRYLESGAECTFAVAHPASIFRLRPEWQGHAKLSAIACPIWEPRNLSEMPQRPTQSFADVLEMAGFTDVAQVQLKAQAWAGFLAKLQPDVVVAEFAPGCTIAARDRFPVLTIGTGYSILPDRSPLPSIAFWSPSVASPNVELENRILDCINRARLACSLQAFQKLAAAFRGDCTYPCTFRSFDPYDSVRDEPVYLPLQLDVDREPEGALHSARSGSVQRGFVYYSVEHPIFRRALSLVLLQSAFPCAVYAPEYSDLFQQPEAFSGHEILTKPLDLKRLREFAFCMHPGGLGVAAAAAIARIPQLLTPVSLESLHTAYALYKQGAAIFRLPDQVDAMLLADDVLDLIEKTTALPMKLHPEFTLAPDAACATQAAIHNAIDRLATH